MSAARIMKALSLTRQAEWAAEQDLSAKDSLYLWSGSWTHFRAARNRCD